MYFIFQMSFTTIIAQNKECDCSAPLNKDLNNILRTSDYRDYKDWLYTYIRSDSTIRSAMKKDKAASWKSSFGFAIDGLPFKGTGDASYSQSDQNQFFTRIEKEYLNNGYVSDNSLKQLFSSQLSDNQLTAYLACLQTCGSIVTPGLVISQVGDSNDEFYIQVKFTSIPSGGKITLDGPALLKNLEPVNGLVFKSPLVIKDGDNFVQFFKRINPNESATFTINTVEKIGIKPLVFPPKPVINTQQVPIGTIVFSVLNYKAFLQANDLIYTSDMGKAIWIPCDGRSLNASKYAAFGTVPDLRGLFVRGVNDYAETYSGVGTVATHRMNPQNKNAGDFQEDVFKTHYHQFGTNNAPVLSFSLGSQPPRTNNTGGATAQTYETGDPNETRPRNLSVYYYIKIN